MSAAARIERDSIGEVEVPAGKYWGAQTQRSLQNFKIGQQRMPSEVIRAFAVLKKASALTNLACGVLSEEKSDMIGKACDEILSGSLDDQFPLVVWQTGSGTQSNMNVNEVIANRGHVLKGGSLTDQNKFLHPNDDVNRSQSSNDTFPTAMHIAAYDMVTKVTIPGVKELAQTLGEKSNEFMDVVKIGRTHFMDATPLTLGQEFSGYVSQLEHGLKALENTLPHLSRTRFGRNGCGNGHQHTGALRREGCRRDQKTHWPSFCDSGKINLNRSPPHDALVETSGALKTLAVSLMKIANDIRMLSSGPRCGIGEILIPANEPGSSIMPGKVNPTQCEAMTMVCAQVIGNDVAINIGGMSGHFELNVFKPMMVYNLLISAQNLGDATRSFNEHCVMGIQPNHSEIRKNLENSLMLVTALNTHIGYDNSAKIAKKAHKENTTLREAALSLGLISSEQFTEWVAPEKMVGKPQRN